MPSAVPSHVCANPIQHVPSPASTVDDNAYTNGLAQWNLEVAAEIVNCWGALARAVAGAFAPAGYRAGGVAPVATCARDLYTGFDEQTGLFEQFRGYFGLEEIDLAAFEPRTAPIDVLLSGVISALRSSNRRM